MNSWFTELDCRIPDTDYKVLSVHVADYDDNHGPTAVPPDVRDGLTLWYEYQESLYSGSWVKSRQSWECGPSTLSVLDGLFRLVNDAVFSRGGWLHCPPKDDAWYGLVISNTLSKYCLCDGMVFCPKSPETTFIGGHRDSDAPEFLRPQDHADIPSCVVRPMNRDDYSNGWFRFMVDGEDNQHYTPMESWDNGTCRLLFTPNTGMFHYEVVSMYRERTTSIVGPFTYDEIMQDLSWEWNNRELDIAGVIETLILMGGDFRPGIPRQVRIEDARATFPDYEKTIMANCPHM